jgi:hypothetical protein
MTVASACARPLSFTACFGVVIVAVGGTACTGGTTPVCDDAGSCLIVGEDGSGPETVPPAEAGPGDAEAGDAGAGGD